LRSVKNIKGTCRFTPYRKLYQQWLFFSNATNLED
jgi:predicted nucleotide-binding protein (sugar kinase/HSP70/actin superfamily)